MAVDECPLTILVYCSIKLRTKKNHESWFQNIFSACVGQWSALMSVAAAPHELKMHQTLTLIFSAGVLRP